jgi:hypothetical protein
MNRTAILVTFAFIGFVIAFASALPAARSGPMGGTAASGHSEVPLHWMARAFSTQPFMPPPPR